MKGKRDVLLFLWRSWEKACVSYFLVEFLKGKIGVFERFSDDFGGFKKILSGVVG